MGQTANSDKAETTTVSGDVNVVGTRHGSTGRSRVSPDRWPGRPPQSPLWRAGKASVDAQVDGAGTVFPAVILSAAKDLSRREPSTGRTDGEIPRLRPRDDRLDAALHSPRDDVDVTQTTIRLHGSTMSR
ncbi:MAG TPA: hypothetical protein VNE17_12855 [Nitrolancea sp.]|nr:hypothetical protein [Nitrolancea sp.]